MIDTPTHLNILILEDNPDDAELLVRELQRANFDPDWKLVATEGDYLAHLDPAIDVILSDYSMPGFSGLRALRLLRERGLDIPFILVSGTVGEDVAVSAIQAGAADYLLKDRLGRLGSAVRRVLENRQLLREKGRIDRQLLKTEKQLANMLEHAAESIIAANESHQIIVFNKAAEKTFGYSAQEALGQPLDLLLPDRLVGVHREHVLNFAASPGESRPIEHRQGLVARRKDGSEFPVEIGISKLNVDGEVIFTAMIVDITERKRAEEAVQQMHDRFKALTENAPDGVALIDRDGHLKLVSPAGRKMFGYGREEEPDINPAEHTHPDDLAMVLTALSNLIENPTQSPTLQYRFRHKDGSWRWIESTFTNLLQVKNVEAIVINFRDITQRREAERALLRSERRYRALFEDSPVAIWEEDFSRIKTHLEQLKQESVTDFRAYFTAHPEAVFECMSMVRILDINRAALEMYQAESKQALLDGIEQLFKEGGWKNFCEDLICVAEGKTGNSWEASEETFTGKPIEISLRWSVAPDHEEDFSKVIVTTIDITERKQAEKKIRQQLERLAALREIDQFITSTFDVQTSMNAVLSRALKLLTVDAAAIWHLDLVRSRLEYGAGIGFRTNAIQTASVRLGESLARKVALEGRIVQIPSVVDRSDEFLLTGFLKDEAFVFYCGAPLLVKGKVLGVLEVYSRSFMERDADWLDFFHTLAGQAAIAIDNAQLFENLQRSNIELEGRVADRTTELNRTNAELEHANRAKDEFLANMSHELRTPLNSILGMAESLLERERDPVSGRQQKSLQIIVSSGRHLLELINDILDLSKVEAGMFDYYPQIISVDEICRSSLSFVRSQALKKSITLLYDNSDQEAATSNLSADPRRLKQILVNLLNNAVKFTPEGGQVTLRVQANVEQDVLQFSVIDTGVGIAAEDLRHLFQPFVQLDSALNRQQEGTGLGLALVQRLTDLHGGSVQVESEPGQGSNFTIILPWKSKLTVPPETVQTVVENITAEKPASREPSKKQGTILLAEDNMANILTIGEYLESHSYEVKIAHDGLEAVQMAEAANPDIILMDIQMPMIDGLEATRRLRATPRFAATPIIALTALAMPGDRERCLEAGATEYMSKPVSLKKLKQTIESFLGS
ncbi:MAG TPA: PAS domain S-box protein [Anaerolineales bacterium]|nr:PAS domain S-box protein [Anaerolineales bacterium]